jgi:hypothetical protein
MGTSGGFPGGVLPIPVAGGFGMSGENVAGIC